MLISKEVYNQLNKVTQNAFEWLEDSKIKGSENPVSLFKLENTM
jgi:hypothetical protein